MKMGEEHLGKVAAWDRVAVEEFHRVQKEKEGGFQAKAVPAGGRADEGVPGMLLRAVRFGFIKESDSFLQTLCKAERQRRNK